MNLNYNLAPFSYIERSTALHAAFKSEKLLAIPTGAGDVYKTEMTAAQWRHHIDARETLKQWEEKFADGEQFRTASEICEMYLVPEGEIWHQQGMKRYWREHALTGDNVKERPYANLHSMLTTKSNSFTVHVIAQTIAKSPDSAADGFDPDLDVVVSSWQGTGHVHRRLDDDDERLPDFARDFQRGREVVSADSLHHVSSQLDTGDREFAITSVRRDPESKIITVTWNSRPGSYYGVEVSTDAQTWTREDIPALHSRNPHYRGLRSQGLQTSFSIESSSRRIHFVRVVRK